MERILIVQIKLKSRHVYIHIVNSTETQGNSLASPNTIIWFGKAVTHIIEELKKFQTYFYYLTFVLFVNVNENINQYLC